MRKVIAIDQVDEPVKHFLAALDAGPEGSVVELDGRRVYLVVQPSNGTDHTEEPWTDEKNRRRAALVDREIAGKLTPAEAAELADLQDQMLHYRDRVAPLPIEYARRLHQELLRKALHADDASE